MRISISFSVVVMTMVAMISASTLAQQSLDKLEGILDAEAAAEPTSAAPRPAEPAPPRTKEFRPGYLGLYAIEVDGQLIVETVHAKSPAAAAKLQPGDVIERIGAAQPANLEQMTDALAPLPVGARVPFTVQRGRRELQLVAVLGERPPASRIARETPQPTPAGDPSSDALGALSELEALLDDAPPDDEPAPPAASESLVLKRISTLEAELKLIHTRIGVLERTLDRVESATEE